MANPPGAASGGAPAKGSKSTASKKGKKPVSRGRKWTFRVLKAIVGVVLLGLVAGVAVGVIGYRSTDVPDANAGFKAETSFVYYGDAKTKMGSFAIQNRQSIPLKEMPESIKGAVVAAENRTFWTDPGISVSGLLRAAWVIARGGSLQGGSTITQQYVKILYLTQDQTLTRKFKELIVASKINKQQSKEEILEGYLNTIYYGRGAYGIQAASRAYFNVDAKKLTVPQAAVLASVINNPSIFDPSADDSNAERLLGRYQYVIASMAETGAITAEQAAEYAKKLPKFPDVPISNRYGGPNGFLMKMVETELITDGFTPSEISGGGLRIVTTFDKTAQDAAVKSAQKYTKEAASAADKKASKLHAAIASVEVGTGEVLALYGGPDYVKNSRNWATTARPTASTFKAYALAAGLKDGYSLRSTFNGNTFTPPGDSVPVRNEFSNQYGSNVNLVRATADSINTAFVDLTTTMEDGPKKISQMAQDAGAAKGKGAGWEEYSRIALGSAEVSPLNQAGAYATFANGGKKVTNHMVREVRNSKDQVVYKASPEEDQVVSKDISRDVTYALSSVVEQGTGQTVQTINRPVAGKTGTNGVNDDITSAWFVAYTKQISTAVMYVAGDSGNEDLDPYARPGDSTFFGGTYPALTWADYMAKASEGMPVEQFDEPAYVNKDKAPSPRPQRTRTQQQTKEPTQSTKSPGPTKTPEPTKTATDKPTPSEPPATSEPPPTTEPPATTTPPPTTTPPATTTPTEPPATTEAPPIKPPTIKPPTIKPPAKPRGNISGDG